MLFGNNCLEKYPPLVPSNIYVHFTLQARPPPLPNLDSSPSIQTSTIAITSPPLFFTPHDPDACWRQFQQYPPHLAPWRWSAFEHVPGVHQHARTAQLSGSSEESNSHELPRFSTRIDIVKE